jgi:hypothetical protein
MSNDLGTIEQFHLLEPLIRQIIQEELHKLTHISVNKVTKVSSKKKKRSEEPLIGLWKDREDMLDVENYVQQLRKPHY